VVGHRDIPGKPALFGTTRAFLDYFNLKSLDELPSLAEIRDMESLDPELDFALPAADETTAESLGAGNAETEASEAAVGQAIDEADGDDQNENRPVHAPE
jgi:segregation and condensation protein B